MRQSDGKRSGEPGLFAFVTYGSVDPEVLTMAKMTYGVGDVIALRESPMRTLSNVDEYTILAVLPEQNGAPQYRVRGKSEGFDRRISHSDIDVERSAASGVVSSSASSGTGGKEPWFKASSIRVNK